jgi:uncharacterized protein
MHIPKDEYLRIKVLPRSATTEIAEIMTDSEDKKTIKIKVRAIPEKGRANKELIKFLSKETGVDIKKIKIISGKSEQLKLIKIAWN